MSAYSEASKAVFEVFDDTSPLVEGLSIDEAFLDVRGMGRIAGPPMDIAVRLRREVLERVGLPITVGVARTKFLAKVASGVAKPDGLLVVPPGGELAFLHPLPVERLWGVGPVTAAKLRERGITTVGQVARLGRDGARGDARARRRAASSHALAHNRDPRRVQGGRRRRSMGAQRALGRGHRSPEALDAVVVGLVDRARAPAAHARRVCRTVVLRLRFDDFSRATRSHTLPYATQRDRADPRRGEGAAGDGHADDPAPGHHARRRRARRTSRTPERSSSCCPSTVVRALDAALDERARPLRHGGHHPRRAARPRPGPGGAAAARLSARRLPRRRSG